MSSLFGQFPNGGLIAKLTSSYNHANQAITRSGPPQKQS
jgi:hypothetical protein